MEMKARGNYLISTLYGTNQGQPPLFSWLIIALSQLLGWDHVLVAARAIAAAATIGSSLVLAWLVTAVTADGEWPRSPHSSISRATPLIYHGWLAIRSALRVFHVRGDRCLWVGAAAALPRARLVATAAVSCAALAKGQTCYLFYGVAAAVLLSRRELRGVLMTPAILVPHLAAACCSSSGIKS
jgi:hypothetical protein